MTEKSVARRVVERVQDQASLDQIAARVEREITLLREKRPHLEDRLDRAANILVTHLACPRSRTLRVRVATGGRAWFLVSGTGGNVYQVSPGDWSCSCPDHHRRGGICKHGLACYVLRRAAQPVQRLRTCDGCEGRFPRRELVELHEGLHDGLAHFDGDLLCRSCADRAGVER